MTIYGAIDLGTNSVRLLIGKVEQGQLVPIRSRLITTRLGERMWERPRLTDEAIERTLAALGEFNQELKELGVARVPVIATSAVRDSQNKQEFVELVKDRLGMEIQVISGTQEAILGYQGVRWGTATNGSIIVLDIGGGSTEFIFSIQDEITAASFNIGAVRLTGSAMTPDEIKSVIEPAAEKIRSLPAESLLVGVGGTITTAVAIREKLDKYQKERVHGQRITLKEIEAIKERLAPMSLAARSQVPGLSSQRADIILAGLEILICCMESVGKDVIQASEADMLYGIIHQQWHISTKGGENI